ncbi:MAG: DNA primase, partial [Muribaculaceae bacterium]|nr:DNA primase [Muribaculaceae bacterium]
EIQEREESEEERRQASEREQMFAVKEFALSHFKSKLTETEDGRIIGLTYFRQRGISDAMIERFRLGYALERTDDLINAAAKAGYKNEFLEKTGLVIVNEQGRRYDRFRGRVIFPVHALSGKVVAFGGRTLRTDKSTAKYVNSPESQIYRKSYELYGMYQARQAISRVDKCILVEGYMDVISMHQAGIENVVASSGTSLTDGQIRMIHRFTQNVTVIYDSDAAGIKASLIGIDLLLAEGLNIKVLLLPEGEDPDSFAQNNPSDTVLKYISDNETDFIRFKTRILLDDAGADPMKRSKVISDILRSISVIPDAVTRGLYADECARFMGVKADMLHAQLKKLVTDINYRQSLKQQGENARSSIADLTPQQIQDASDDAADRNAVISRRLRPFEEALLRLVIRHGNYAFATYPDPDRDGQTLPLRVAEYVAADMETDQVSFSDPAYAHVFHCAMDMIRNDWADEREHFMATCRNIREKSLSEGRQRLSEESLSVADITRGEIELTNRVDSEYEQAMADFDADFISRKATSSPDDLLRRISTTLVADPHQLSKIYTRTSHV